jgi:heat-inducible transcriptional repressor
LKDRLIGLTLKEIQSTMKHRLNDAEMYDHELVQILINERYSYFTIDSNNKIYTSSTNVLLDQPEFHDLTSYQRVLPVLEKPFLNHHFKENFHLNSNNTLIGTENGDIRLEDCAIITTQFDSGMMQGRIGVIGPKRVPYFSLKALLEKFTEIVQSAI